VGRHGPIVLRVCRVILRDPHDAEDAFQATFLVLVKNGLSKIGWQKGVLGSSADSPEAGWHPTA
jgi:DNA-directed RNA polymerase specialized sigma24 family protein